MDTNKKDVSIEYAHIYTNNRINKEQETALQILKKVKQELQNNNQTNSLVVLVDDYSFPDPTFSYDTFIDWLSDKGFKPGIVMRESQLIPLCDEVVSLIKDTELREQIVDYIKSKKYPCSLFIAAWYLLRLGYLKNQTFNRAFCADKLINILPKSFKPFEEKGLEIISQTPYSKAVDQITYMYFDGRLIA